MLWVSMLRINRCGQIRSMFGICCRAQVSRLPLTKPRLNPGRHCPIWHCCLSSIIRKKAKTSGTGLCSSAREANLSCWIRLVTCHPISVRILMPCSPSGSSRSKMHNKALLSPLSRLGRLTLRSSRPKACRYKANMRIEVAREACCSQDDQLGPLNLQIDLPEDSSIWELAREIGEAKFLQFSSPRNVIDAYCAGKLLF